MDRTRLKLAIVGSRDYPDLMQVVRFVCILPMDTIVVSGGARGVDKVAEKAAKDRGLPEPIIYYPKWTELGKGAGKIRNTDIAETADAGVAFWDGASQGTLDTIEKLRALGKLIEIVQPGDDVLCPRLLRVVSRT